MPGLTTETTLPECENCGGAAELFWNDRFGGSLCEDCDERYPAVYVCSRCGLEHDDPDAAHDCCRHYCAECGMEHRYEDEAHECCWSSCSNCGTRHQYEEDAESCCAPAVAELPFLPPIDPYRVEVPVIDGRPARLCSLEQELVAGGNQVARLLFQQSASTYDHILSYHSSASQSRPGTVHVEEDGSLPHNGGEVVYDRFDLSSERDIGTMSRILTRIRQLRDSGSGQNRPVRTGFAAGIHVHIAAKAANGDTLGPEGVAALYELWCYAEDMLYAFSAAGWNRHRQPNDHGGYCKPVPKALNASPREVWRLMRSDRYYGLNFQRLFGAVANCSCGAATMGDWGSCDCGAFDKATVEWRVFNASTRPQTIHAWIVMAHAMTAYAAQHTLRTLPSNPMGSQTPAEKREVLHRLLEVLPLTEGERDLIRDTADRSPGL